MDLWRNLWSIRDQFTLLAINSKYILKLRGAGLAGEASTPHLEGDLTQLDAFKLI